MEASRVSLMTPEQALSPAISHAANAEVLLPFQGAELSHKSDISFELGSRLISTTEFKGMSISEISGLIGKKPDFSVPKSELIRDAKKAQMQALVAKAYEPKRALLVDGVTHFDFQSTQTTKTPSTSTKKTINSKQDSQKSPKTNGVKPAKPIVDYSIDKNALSSLLSQNSNYADTDSHAPLSEPVAVTEVPADYAAIDMSGITSVVANTPDTIFDATVDNNLVNTSVSAKSITASIVSKLSHTAHTMSEKLPKVGKGIFKWGSAGVVVLATYNMMSPDNSSEPQSKVAADITTIHEVPTTTQNTTVTSQPIEEAIVATATPAIEREPATTAVPSTTISPATTIETTSSTIAQTTTTAIPETTIPPRPATTLESLLDSERILEDIPGTEIAQLSLPGACLDDIAISVMNAADPVRNPEIMQGFDWNLLNQDENMPPVAAGDYVAARERLNPVYKVRADETPQETCEMTGDSEYTPRWERSPKGSYIAQQFRTVGEIKPQADIYAGSKKHGIPSSVLPSQAGVMYIQGHRTHDSAPFANLDALVQGQTAELSDGYNTYTYVFKGFETVRPDINIPNEILNRDTYGKHMMIISTCDDGSAVRLLAIFEQQIQA